MRNMIKLIIGGGLVAAATPAFAQEVTSAFTGPRVEALVGYDNLSNGRGNVRDSTDGFNYGLGAGYDVQLNKLTLGIEGEIMGSSSKARGYDIATPGDTLQVRNGRDLYIGGRVGVAVAPTTLLYVKGGYTNLKLNARYYDPSGFYAADGRTLDGWRVGAGVEQKFSLFGPGGYAKLEYRYSNYTNLNIGSYNANIDLDRHQVVGGIGVRF